MIVYIDCIGGAAGDMLLAALLDAGGARDAVETALRATGTSISLNLGRVSRGSISALRAEVDGPVEHAHRCWSDVRRILDAAGLDDRAHEWAHDSFRRLAIAEARVHGIETEQVHFHEVGALDAIADIVGACVALDTLGADEVVCSALPVARGFVEAAHGLLPLPAPATLEILRERGAPLGPAPGAGELVTPTGAALLCAVADSFGPWPAMTPRRIGYGAGSRDPSDRPNLVRVTAGDRAASDARAPRPLCLLETNLDDMTPELVPDATAAALSAGAVDVWTTPVQMKKGRPGIVLSALALPADREAVASTLLRHTTTLGVRMTTVERHELDRDWIDVDAGDGPVRVKRGWLDGALLHAAPEHDDCARVAALTGRPVHEVWARAMGAAALAGPSRPQPAGRAAEHEVGQDGG